MENLKAESLQEWSIANWGRVPEADRKRCLDHLRATLEGTLSGVGCLGRWRAQAGSTLNGKPVAIGSDDRWFHFGAGMAIRNILRQVMTDDHLPPIDYGLSSLQLPRNWDDYYIGVLHALATEPEAKPKADILDRLRRWLGIEDR